MSRSSLYVTSRSSRLSAVTSCHSRRRRRPRVSPACTTERTLPLTSDRPWSTPPSTRPRCPTLCAAAEPPRCYRCCRVQQSRRRTNTAGWQRRAGPQIHGRPLRFETGSRTAGPSPLRPLHRTSFPTGQAGPAPVLPERTEGRRNRPAYCTASCSLGRVWSQQRAPYLPRFEVRHMCFGSITRCGITDQVQSQQGAPYRHGFDHSKVHQTGPHRQAWVGSVTLRSDGLNRVGSAGFGLNWTGVVRFGRTGFGPVDTGCV